MGCWKESGLAWSLTKEIKRSDRQNLHQGVHSSLAGLWANPKGLCSNLRVSVLPKGLPMLCASELIIPTVVTLFGVTTDAWQGALIPEEWTSLYQGVWHTEGAPPRDFQSRGRSTILWLSDRLKPVPYRGLGMTDKFSHNTPQTSS